ncbi:MAG TPA: rod shape-determining protein MreD [Allosphingosinicella sp.]|nr:rod shape-determining protein MreD [Allosphingosinicella sp.]
MSRTAGSRGAVAFRDLRRRFMPVGSTLAASLLALFPIVASRPLVPEFALLVVIAWRLLRPEIWPAYMALGLGLFNDLVAGHPLGQSMALWTIIFLACDYIDSRLGFRDHWMDWLIAAAALLFHSAASWYIAMLMGATMDFALYLPQLGVAVLIYPLVARMVLGLDRWRLSQ